MKKSTKKIIEIPQELFDYLKKESKKNYTSMAYYITLLFMKDKKEKEELSDNTEIKNI